MENYGNCRMVVFPISYIINDCIAEVWGFRKARLIIWMGFAMNFMVVALAQLAMSDARSSVLGRRGGLSTSFSAWRPASL